MPRQRRDLTHAGRVTHSVSRNGIRPPPHSGEAAGSELECRRLEKASSVIQEVLAVLHSVGQGRTALGAKTDLPPCRPGEAHCQGGVIQTKARSVHPYSEQMLGGVATGRLLVAGGSSGAPLIGWVPVPCEDLRSICAVMPMGRRRKDRRHCAVLHLPRIPSFPTPNPIPIILDSWPQLRIRACHLQFFLPQPQIHVSLPAERILPLPSY
jgi:hypothetical protein